MLRVALLDRGAYLIPDEEIQWSQEGSSATLSPKLTEEGVYTLAGVAVGETTLVADALGQEARIHVLVTPQE